MAIDTLKRIGSAICNDYLGFLPTTNATKPPHVANGLFRCCTGEVCNTRDIHEWIISDGLKNAVSSNELINKYKDILQNGNQEQETNIKQLRFLLNDIFDQDNTVYPNYDFSVMTLSSHWMLKSKVNPEVGIGDFLFKILSKEIDGERSHAIEIIQRALDNDSDDMTKLVKPIIAFPSEKEKRTVNGVIYPNEDEISWDSCKQIIRDGFDRLSASMEQVEESKNSLLVLRRIVNYSIFATFFYLINCNHALYKGYEPPIVIDAGGGLESIERASEQAYTIAKKAVEDYFTNAIKQLISQEIAKDSIDECQRWIDDMAFSSTERGHNIRMALQSYFENFCDEEESALYALAKAIQIILYTLEYKNNSPSDFCRVLGVRAGLIGPKGNRAIKRYLINSFTLETITLSALKKDEISDGIELKELSNRLLSLYNILLGANSESEYNVLEKYNIAQATPGDLRGDLSVNAQWLANTYISLGWGKKYADGVTLIGWRL